MSTTTTDGISLELEKRVLNEGYGEGAWHGPDLKAALADVTQETAFGRPAPGRHSIAEIALHHAYCVADVRAKLSGVAAEPFIVEGNDGLFTLPDSSKLSWATILGVVQSEQERLTQLVTDIDAGRTTSPLPASEQFGLVLGIACHAVYHAGQIQLIKRLLGV